MTPQEAAVDRARALWEDRHGTLAIARDRWRRIAFAALAFAALALGLAVWAAVSSRYIPYIVTIDAISQPRAALAPETITDWPDEVVRHQIGAFIRDWRSVSTDAEVMRGRLNRIQYFLETGTAANAKIRAWAKENDPFRRAETQTVDIEINSVNHLGSRSWIAEWSETARQRSTGRVETMVRYRSSFTLEGRRVRDDSVLLQNPLGIAIVDYDIVRLQ